MRMHRLAVALAGLALAACTDPEGAGRMLEIEGVTDVQITGYVWFACGSRSDLFSTGFSGTRNGRRVEGAVCRGIFTGQIVRYR